MPRLTAESTATAVAPAQPARQKVTPGGVPSPGPAARPLRADAQRNRDSLVKVATDAFSQFGVDASLEEIARRAGVGIGTLYRHFPTRDDLVLAVYQNQIESLRLAAIELPLRLEPAEALQEWMRQFVGYAGIKRGIVALLKTMMETDSQLFDQPRETIRTAAQSLLDAAVAAGVIRTDMRAPELVRAMGGICMVTDRPGTDEVALTLVDLIFDGLRFGAARETAARENVTGQSD